MKKKRLLISGERYKRRVRESTEKKETKRGTRKKIISWKMPIYWRWMSCLAAPAGGNAPLFLSTYFHRYILYTFFLLPFDMDSLRPPTTAQVVAVRDISRLVKIFLFLFNVNKGRRKQKLDSTIMYLFYSAHLSTPCLPVPHLQTSQCKS